MIWTGKKYITLHANETFIYFVQKKKKKNCSSNDSIPWDRFDSIYLKMFRFDFGLLERVLFESQNFVCKNNVIIAFDKTGITTMLLSALSVLSVRSKLLKR